MQGFGAGEGVASVLVGAAAFGLFESALLGSGEEGAAAGAVARFREPAHRRSDRWSVCARLRVRAQSASGSAKGRGEGSQTAWHGQFRMLFCNLVAYAAWSLLRRNPKIASDCNPAINTALLGPSLRGFMGWRPAPTGFTAALRRRARRVPCGLPVPGLARRGDEGRRPQHPRRRSAGSPCQAPSGEGLHWLPCWRRWRARVSRGGSMGLLRCVAGRRWWPKAVYRVVRMQGALVGERGVPAVRVAALVCGGLRHLPFHARRLYG